MAHIVFENVHLQFDVRRRRRISFKDFIVRGMFRRSANPRIKVNALSGVSFEIREGDRVGIIGHNGAGKSTLLKTIAGVYPPTHGRRDVEGRISSLFDVTLGFESEASGWETIAYRGYLQGETPKSIATKVKSIAEFSELGEYLDMTVGYYSTGMTVRLGFAIATATEPEILIVDEILGAGDLAFQQKARQRMDAMITNAKVVVLASHDLSTVSRLCNRVIWMDHGHVRQMGPPEKVIEAYTASTQQPQLLAA